ncbi:MAG TPA: hypothetical protein QF720_02740 [Nitrospinota bacterium]|nr:hypothetical protein [Nitrospinota bacterium]
MKHLYQALMLTTMALILPSIGMGCSGNYGKKEEQYPRIYNETIKGLWEPGAWQQLAEFANDAAGEKRLKSLGLNTISVVASFYALQDGQYSLPHRDSIEREIERYKKLGFAVFLSGNSKSYSNGSQQQVDPEKVLENYLLSCKKAAIELAEIGEQYNVEYYSPSNELEGTLDNEAFPSYLQSQNFNPPETPFDAPDEGTNNRVKVASEWMRNILPSLENVFSGKIIAKVGGSHPDYNVEGYDYLAFTIDSHYLNKPDFRRLINKQYIEIAQSATNSGVSWMVGEAYFHHGEPGMDMDTETKEFLKDMQQHYFDISLDEYILFDQVPKPLGYIFIGYFMEGIEIKDSVSEAVIGNYFELMH